VTEGAGEGSFSAPPPDRVGDDSDVSVTHMVGKTIAGTHRTSIELLDLPFPFSQVSLLTVDEFVKAADQRRIHMGGHSLNPTGLEELHRYGVLVPIFCVSIGQDADPSLAIDTSSSLTRQHVRSTVVRQLYEAATEGRLSDPANHPFSPWPRDRLRTEWPSVARGYLYSFHQLIGLERARSLVQAIKPHSTEQRGVFSWRLPHADMPNSYAADGLKSWRALAMTLSAVDTRVWPNITQVIHHSDEIWRASNLSQSAPQLLEWLGLTVDQLRREADHLRSSASFDDVLGEFYDVVRRANPNAWDSLLGDARTALDSRIAAEVLDGFADEVEGIDTPPSPPPNTPLRQQRLSDRPNSIDAVLTNLHLSPHPSLVIAIEGATEMLIVPRVMQVLGMRMDPSWIRLVNFEGTKDLSLLARFAAEPVLGDDHGDFVILDRPVTRFLVLTDAENKFKTQPGRRKQRKLLLDSISAPLPADLRPDLYSQGARIVEIMTWGPEPFEFAHFSDGRLADAMLGLAASPHPGGRSGLIQSIHKQRTLDPSPDVEDAWREPGVNKLALADALWPTLAARIERAIAKQTTGPPVMKAVLRAYELAMLSYKRNMSVRRHR